ncbi:MAG: ubiquinol-cytochrome c reductase iron-sulfur subunit [Planctomycetaceae bacterium]
MSDQNPSTEDILSKIRGGAAKPSSPTPEQPADDSGPSAAAAEEKPAAAKPAASKPAAAPSGTADILASLRAGKAAADAPAGGKSAAPKSTSDVLASVKSDGGGAKSGGGATKPAAPGGTADILASLRSGKGGAAASAKPAAGKAAAGKAAGKTAAAKADVSAASGMSAAEMIRAAREGGAAAGAKAKAPGKVALPGKPLAKASPSPFQAPQASEPKETRRSMLSWLVGVVSSPIVVAWTAMAAAGAASALATARFMMPNVLVEPPTKFKIGPPTDYDAGTVSTKWKAQFGVWIVNAEVDGKQIIYALSTVCTHLGCTPNWLDGEQKFKCPCHGSGFYKNGVNFEGPAPRPLERMGIRLADDGMLEVDKSVKFQQELGQWSNPASFVPVA